MMRRNTHHPQVAVIVVDDDPAVLDHARDLFAHDIPFGVVSGRYTAVVPFMLGNNGHTVALVADVDDPDQLAQAIALTEHRLGPVGAVIRYASDLPRGAEPTDGPGPVAGSARTAGPGTTDGPGFPGAASAA